MDRKAQGLSLNIIIVAAIGLLVLVILSVIFIGKMGGTSRDIDNCQTKGGTCIAEDDFQEECLNEGGRAAPPSWKCLDSLGDVVPETGCCVKI